MRTDETDLQQVLRRAMGRAGLVSGHLHVCRRKNCRYEEEAKDSVLRTCPGCRMKLWPKALPRHLRFHDLRHEATSRLFKRADLQDIAESVTVASQSGLPRGCRAAE